MGQHHEGVSAFALPFAPTQEPTVSKLKGKNLTWGEGGGKERSG